ncbi:hypothetical protein FZEAL_7515 [Fusarium zealandicum]|uniref:Uncharacterized protein n=1 Tax=Fusarium zealandicum TaxID=1053134 RepID=A0A8H4XHR6_9HYPO|nr:hypothetical protein FZEAL_7515 [Fusarium zealandicum]
MSKLVQDVKSGLKGIRGAGDAIRGEALEATDKAFNPNPTNPSAIEAQAENKGISQKGKHDMKGADEMFARREWEKKGVVPPAHAGTRQDNVHPHAGVPSNTQPVSNAQYGAHQPGEALVRGPGAGTQIPDETANYATERPNEALGQHPGVNVTGANVPGGNVPGGNVPGGNVPGGNVPGAQRYV